MQKIRCQDMEEFSSSFSLENGAFPFHQTVPTEYLQKQTIRQDLAIPAASLTDPVLERNELITNVDKRGKRQRKAAAVQEDAGIRSAADNQEKRIVHRDVERQRRQEMANLLDSLRELLPLEYIKGKRSMSEQVNEAVNYIKYQENNIRQLQEKRDKLRNLLAGSNPNAKEGTSRKSCPADIRVRQCSHGGIEILVSQAGEEQCPLSSVLKVLVEEGLSVVSYLCTKVNEKFFYTIETEAIHITGLDIGILLQKLSHRIKASTNFH